MSPVQAAILGKLPTERDMFVTSKTGTGKTLAFLIPAVETLARRRAKNSGKKGGIIVISPTAELASQVANEAHNLCRYHKFGVQKFVGGGNQRAQVASFGHNPADVIVGTPGALDYLMNWSNNFYKLVQNVQVVSVFSQLVLDDADQLLEMDSRKIQDIVDQSPESRQTLLFSTAVPDDLERLASIGLREDHDVFDFVPENEQNVHAHIAQRYAVHDTVKIPQLIHQIARANNNRKIILFCPTDQASRLYSHFLRSAGIRRVFELHAGKPPAIRSTVSDGFRSCQNGVLVTTDLLACGVDYPDVHMVIQLGIPCSRDQYINRIRRTGRAGGGGSALLVLSSWEKSFLKSIADLPIKPCADWSAKTMARKYGGGTLDDPEGDLMRQRGVKSVEEAMVHDYIRSLRVFCEF
ncbi:MAG: P-loop containing nucleoside triphosphate hydrolase protein [Olpidium bornovanus]|uniref:ATP-dependent RNA helicase n=1 Tax=Olpidium bornovanus TaxID=278681 RepID=A0A8H8DIY8_9FUNG|nr:MAG: P-loop containing nucleoside triphosphate hydrolase protein [Olpidium bornovanus]